MIECGAQATGGLWHGWNELPDLAGIGYPIAEIAADGSCMITKPAGTGGRSASATVTEQLLYEIDDPARYRTPDVDVDFTTVSMTESGPDRVAVTGATGPSAVGSAQAGGRLSRRLDGQRHAGRRGARRRGQGPRGRELVLERVRRAGVSLADSLVECLGAGDVAPGVIRPAAPPFEVVLRVTVRDPERAAVERFCRELAPLVTAGPPGIAGYAAGRPSPRPAFGYWPALVPRSLAEERTRVDVRTAAEWAEASCTIAPNREQFAELRRRPGHRQCLN